MQWCSQATAVRKVPLPLSTPQDIGSMPRLYSCRTFHVNFVLPDELNPHSTTLCLSAASAVSQRAVQCLCGPQASPLEKPLISLTSLQQISGTKSALLFVVIRLSLLHTPFPEQPCNHTTSPGVSVTSRGSCLALCCAAAASVHPPGRKSSLSRERPSCRTTSCTLCLKICTCFWT